MVFGWLFGDKKQKEEGSDVSALVSQADEATLAKDSSKGEELCREALRRSSENADAWTLLGVNLIRKGMADPAVRAEAVMAWMRALALRPGDSRAADHLRVEIQYPDDLVPQLVKRLSDEGPSAEDAAGALTQIGEKAKPALEQAASSSGALADRARTVLGGLGSRA